MVGVEVGMAAAKVLTPVATSLAQPLKRSIHGVVRRKKAGISRKDVALLGELDVDAVAARFNRLALYSKLPGSVSLKDIERALGSPPVKSNLRELMSVAIAGSDDKAYGNVKELFIFEFARSIGGCTRSEAESLASETFDELGSFVSDLMEKVKAVDPETFAEFQRSAEHRVYTAILARIDEHLASQRDSADADRASDFEKWEHSYKKQVEAAFGYLEPPDFDRKRKIPIRDLYVSPQISWMRSSGSMPIYPAFSEISRLIPNIDRSVLVGDPGGGKSTASRMLAYTTATENFGLIPFVVVLRNLPLDPDSQVSIVQHLYDRVENFHQCKAPEGCIEDALLSGRAFVVFDGLDELIDLSKRRDVTDKIEQFCNMYPLAKVLVTSRKVGYSQAQLDPVLFTGFELSGFSNSSVRAYIRKWFACAEDYGSEEVERISRALYEESSTVPDLRRNPLLLALMCIIYQGDKFLPKNRPAVYERCANLLFEKWDSSRKINVELKAGPYVDAAMKHLAFWMLTNQSGEEAVTEAELIVEATRFLGDRFEHEDEARRASTEFVEFCRGRAWVFAEVGTTASGEALFKFTHRTFMEYFAAHHLTRTSDGPRDLGRKLLPRVSNQEWDMVSQLAVQIQDKNRHNGAEEVLNYLLSDRRRRSTQKRDSIVAFAARCLTFLVLPPSTVRSISSLAYQSTRALFCEGDGDIVRNSSLRELSRSSEESWEFIRDELEKNLSHDLDSSELTSRQFARFVIAEADQVWPEGWSAGGTRAESWREFQRDLFSSKLDRILCEGESIPLHWYRACSLELVSIGDLTLSACTSQSGPLDSLFTMPTSTFLGYATVPFALRCMPMESVDSGPRWASFLDADSAIRRLKDVNEIVLNSPNAPYCGFSLENSAIIAYLLENLSPSFERAPRELHWAMIVLYLTLIELAEDSIDWEALRTASPTAQALLARRSGQLDASLNISTVNLNISSNQVAILESWSNGLVKFVDGGVKVVQVSSDSFAL